MENTQSKSGSNKIGEFNIPVHNRTRVEEILDDFIEKNPMSIQIVDKDGFTLKVNPAHTRLFGAVPPAGFSIFDDLQRKNPEFEPLILVAKSGELVNLPDLFYNAHDVSPDFPNAPVWIRAIIFPLKDHDGKPERFVFMHENITERKCAEDLLKKTGANYENFFNASEDFLFVLDLQGNIIHANTTVIDRLGYPREELLGKSVLLVHPPERRDEAARIVGEMIAGITTSCPVPLMTQTGMQIPVETKVSHGFWDGNPVILGVAKDISKIKLSEEKFSKVFYLNPSACGLSDPDNLKYIEVNEEFCRLFGFTKEEVIGKTAMELGILTQEAVSEVLLNTDKRGNSINIETDLKAKNGDIRHVLLSAEIIHIQDKRFRYTVVNDITERKRAEEVLAESEDRLKQAQKLAQIACWEYNLSTGKFWGSDEAFRFFGLPVPDDHELYKSDFKLYIQDFEKSEQALFDLIENDITFDKESLIIPANGDPPRILHSVGKLVKDKNGSPLKVLGMFQDITGRKREEELVKESEEKFRSISEQSPDLIALSDANGLITYASSSSRALFQIEPEEMCGRNFIDFVHEASIPAAIKAFRSTLDSGQGVKNLEFIMKRTDGSCFIGELTGSLFTSNGQVGTLVIIHDITERKQAEADLIASKIKAEESDRLKTAFLANMSHEIRTPMNGILGFAGLLKEPDLTGSEQQQYISIIEKSGARMLNIINDIVDISKIESGLMEVSISETNINEQIEDIFYLFREEANKKGLALFFKNALSSKEAVLKTDVVKLSGILTNLIKNAIKFTNTGAIEFGYTVGPADPQGSPPEIVPRPSEVVFFVKDTGIGIPAERHKAIFDRFVQADIDDMRAFQGAGLGLSISKAYVEMLGGKIWVESKPGTGSIFYFALPYNLDIQAVYAVKKADPVEYQDIQIKTLKMLIVEDDETSEMFITTVVEKIGKDVLHAINGIEAVEICRNNPDLDLVLMDIKMPEMDGYEATRQIRKFNQDIVIIAQTAFGLAGDREKAIASGCNDYISKPINKDELIALITEYFK